jgi:hypothetical protein
MKRHGGGRVAAGFFVALCAPGACCTLGGALAPGTAHAALRDPLDKHPPPTWSWALVQAVPHVQLLAGTNGPRFGVGWQVSPLVWSFGMHRRLSPWRTFVVEPLTRV